jgi:hypothetical protein
MKRKKTRYVRLKVIKLEPNSILSLEEVYRLAVCITGGFFDFRSADGKIQVFDGREHWKAAGKKNLSAPPMTFYEREMFWRPLSVIYRKVLRDMSEEARN